jgi:hypothetical protein
MAGLWRERVSDLAPFVAFQDEARNLCRASGLASRASSEANFTAAAMAASYLER